MPSQYRPALPLPALVLVTRDASIASRSPEGDEWIDDVAREAAFGGVNVVQLRQKHLDTRELILLGLHVKDAITDRALFIVNGDVDAARTLGADGIHLPEDGPSIEDVRGQVGDRMLISRAVHSLEAAQRAADEGADLLQLGTVFETASKPGAGVLGPAGVREVCEAVCVPVIAIGGITADNAADVMAAGAAGVAVIDAIFGATDPRAAATALRRAITKGAGR